MGTCLTTDEVEAFAAGDLSDRDMTRFEAHLISCPQCRQAIDDCRRDNDLAMGIQQAYGCIALGDPEASTIPGSGIPGSGALGSGQPPDIADAIEGYEILHEIHRGGQGVVYKAVQVATKRTVALKVLLQGRYASPTQQHRFAREIDLVASMQHPNIVTLFDSSTTRGRHYFAMEYIHGQPLDTYVSTTKLTVDAKLKLFQKICTAVTFAHQRGVIHRDLKPGNILVDAEGEPHILDFGLAKAAGPDLQNGLPVTVSGDFMGTLAYASPEQTKGDPGLIDIRTDVYSLGVILFEMLTGGYPYEVVGRMAEVLNNIDKAAPRRPSTVSRGINDEVETIVLKALAKEKDRRYQSAETLARDVGHYLAGDPLDAKRDSTWYVIRKSLRRHRAAVGVAIAFVILLTASTIALSIMYRDQSRARHEADEAREIADQRYDQIIRLADIKRLADARGAADDLWPAHPENIQAMENWLEAQAIPLRDNLPKHEAALALLRDQALDYDTAQQAHDRETHPLNEELIDKELQLVELRAQLAEANAEPVTAEPVTTDHTEGQRDPEETQEAEDSAASASPNARAEKVVTLKKAIAETERRIDDLQTTVKIRRTWRFPDAQTQWRHDTLAALVEDLKTFVLPDPNTGTLADVEKRLAFARSIETRSTTGPEAAALWAKACADIAQLEVYGGLRLTPQVGLRPLRRDPRSGLWEFWHIQTGEKPELRPDAEETPASPWNINKDTGIVFVLIPGGTFWMGAQSEDPERPNYDANAESDAGPVNKVTLSPFFLSKYEMTQGQWQGVTGSNPSRYGPDFTWNSDPPSERPFNQNQWWNPVEEISWDDCRAVLDRLGLAFPTEAQWEYAARAGTETVWWTGSEGESIGALAAGNVADGGTKRRGGPGVWLYDDWLDDGWTAHAPVGSFSPNGFGLHDTIGNLWELCRDRWSKYDRKPEPGHGLREAPGSRFRAYRGGGFSNTTKYCRSAFRNHIAPELRRHYLGIRPARRIHR